MPFFCLGSGLIFYVMLLICWLGIGLIEECVYGSWLQCSNVIRSMEKRLTAACNAFDWKIDNIAKPIVRVATNSHVCRVVLLKWQTDLIMYILCRFLMLFHMNMKNPFKLQGSDKNLLSSYNKGLSSNIVFNCFFSFKFDF